MSTSWSSSCSSVRDEKASSPIRYRERPLEYEPPILCRCGAKAARWISWSNDNPGRRYVTCYRARFDGCDFYEWVDDKPSEFLCQVLRDLRDAIYGLKNDKVLMKRQLEEAVKTIGDTTKELGMKSKELHDARAMIHDAVLRVSAKEYIETETETILKLKDEEIEHLRKYGERKNGLLKFTLVILVVVVIKLALPY